MKRFWVISCLPLFFIACVEDNSTGVINILDEVTIQGVDDRYENVYVGHRFTISPEVTNISGNLSHLEYSWFSYNTSTYNEADTLSKEKDLDIEVSLTPGEHTLKFRVTDVLTSIFYEKECVVNVVNDFTNGLMILGQCEGVAELDFWIPGRDEVVEDLYGRLNGGAILGEIPRRVVFTPYMNEMVSEVIVMCHEGGKILDNLTMACKRDYSNLFFGNEKESMKPQAYFRSSMREYLIDGGLIYDRAVNSNPPDMQMRPAMSSPYGEYEIATEANFGDDVEPVSRMVVYDNRNQCFYTLYNITSAFLTTVKNTSGMTYIDGGAFDPDHVGMTCLYANICSRSDTEAREYAGVFQDGAGDLWLLRIGIGFWVDGASPNRYLKDISKIRFEAENADKATSFACDASFPDYLFYTVDNAVYAYSMSNKTGYKVYDFSEEGNYQIDHIELERKGRRLWVAFRNLDVLSKPAGFAGLYVQTDGGLKLRKEIWHEGLADIIVDFESKY